MKRPLSIVALEAALLMVWMPAHRLASAQNPSTDASKAEDIPNISVDVDVVNILFTVTDKQGRLITNLNKEDFVVEEEGQPQTVKYFSRQTDLPLTMGLLVDTSASQGTLIDIERDASSQFFHQMLRQRKDQAFLLSFDVNVDLLQDYTDSVRLLRAGLEKLRVNGGGIGGGPMPSSSKPRGTLLYDAVYLAANDMLKNQVGRKTLVLITDGVDQGSQMDIKQAIATAQRSDAIIYCIDYEDRGFYYRGGYMIGGPSSDPPLGPPIMYPPR